MTELRSADLRFDSAEASAFLRQVMGLELSSGDIAALETRTEGWIAGLQLAALSMQGCPDMPAFIRTFAGNHRYVVDYLVEEVLRRQPEQIRRFLLQTSILDRLQGSLCDAVTGQTEGGSRLEYLEQGNFFVVSLDDRREWYRYHHLFAEVLSARLKTDDPGQVAGLHLRASLWHESHGSAADAVRHALAAPDYERAANLIEPACPAMARSGQEAVVLRWVKELPGEVVRRRPVLSVWYAGALLAGGRLEEVRERLRDAEYWLEIAADARERQVALPSDMVVVDAVEYRRLPGSIAMYRSGLALVQGDVPDTMRYARLVLDLAPEDDHLRRGAASALLGLAAWRNGELEDAYRLFSDGIANVQSADALPDAIHGAVALADIRIAQGRLREAMSAYERALRLAADRGEPAMRGTSDIFVGMSELYQEWDERDVASRYLSRSKEQGELAGFPQSRYRWRVAMARIREARGDLDGALESLQEAERLYASDFFLNRRPVPALIARLRLAQGRLGEALDWVRASGLSAQDDLSYPREFEHVTLARVLLARYGKDRADRLMREAKGLLERLLQAAVAGGRTGSAIEILVVQATACQLQGDIRAALAPLTRALTLAEPEGYVRIFADEGRAMEDLLKAALQQGIAVNYVRRLLTAFGQDKGQAPPEQADARLSIKQPLEPLSERERDVLRLLATELSGPDIARELFVSINTLRTHTKNIYDKLEANNRRTAVRRATELELL